MNAKVMKVNKVLFHLTKSKPPQLLLYAEGEVPTSGWSDAQLSPYVYLAPPKDGIWDFDFIAAVPTGIVLDVVSPVAADFHSVAPPWFKGVRVHAGANNIGVAAASRAKQPSVRSFIPIPWGKKGESKLQGGGEVFPWAQKL